MTTQTKPIEAYSLPTPNGQKVHIMLEELGVPWNYHRIDIGKGEQFTPEFLAISPNNKIPAIVDPEGPGGEAISIFGADRCMFASNFPVERAHGAFDDFYKAYDAATADFSDDERRALFGDNAKRLYRIA